MHLKLNKKNLKIALFVVLAVVAYLLLRQATGFYIPCLFHRITGLQCPGCGSTRMLTALMHLDFKTAYSFNPFLLITGPFLAFEIIYEFFLTHDNKLFERINTVLLSIYCAAILLFGVVRNVIG